MASISTIEMAAPDGTQGPVLALAEFTDYRYRLQNVIPAPGGQYTFSVWARAEAGMQVILDVLGESFVAEVTAEWTKIVHTVADAADVSIDIYPMEDAPLYLYQGMLQKGQYDTDWKPAPEDGEDTDAALTEKVADLAITADGITAQVAQQANHIDGLQGQISLIQQTADGVSIQVQNILENGAPKVVTERGFTFDDGGLHIRKSGQEMENLLDETGMYVTRSGETVLQANSQGVLAVDVTVRNYLIVGSHARFEDYGDDRTACFWR